MLGDPDIAIEFAGMTGGLKKLKNHNYINWKVYIESYVQG